MGPPGGRGPPGGGPRRGPPMGAGPPGAAPPKVGGGGGFFGLGGGKPDARALWKAHGGAIKKHAATLKQLARFKRRGYNADGLLQRPEIPSRLFTSLVRMGSLRRDRSSAGL